MLKFSSIPQTTPYQQVFGMAMDSPLSLHSACIHGELQTKSNGNQKCGFIVCPYGAETLYGFLNQLSNLKESIIFTMEVEMNNRILYLNIQKRDNGLMRTRKPTPVRQFLQNESNHPHNIKC